MDLFTFLPAPRVEGLQVLNRANMKWVRLDAPPGSIVLNTGDYMQRISNDVLPSTTHRVSPPRDPDAAPAGARLVPDGGLRLGGRAARGAAGSRHAEVPADQGDSVPHPHTSKLYGDDYAVTEG